MKMVMSKVIACLFLLACCNAVKAQDMSKVTINTVWYQSDSVFAQIYPTTSVGTEMNGVFKKKMKMVYNGTSSDVKVKEITIYAYANAAYMQSPANFGIIPLTQESDKRTYLWLSASAFKAKTNDNIISVKYEKVVDNIFKVTPERKLLPGEYGFLMRVAGIPTILYGFTIVE